MKKNTQYEELTSRNIGYVEQITQEKIAQTRVLIAGCGIGSQVAEAAARLGFQKFVLIDGDTVDASNLNRQSFFNHQIDQPKVLALKENILRINSEAQVTALHQLLSPENSAEIVFQSDLIFDTIDFLDLKAIVALHDQAHSQKKMIISSFSVGFGAAAICFAPNKRSHSWIREIFDLPLKGDIGSVSYVERYIKLFSNLAAGLDPVVLNVMTKVFRDLADGKTCPAPQIAPGASAVAALCLSAAVQYLAGESITGGPEMVVLNLLTSLRSPGFQLVTRQALLKAV
jgi:molybdopterin/thiamine biosynthesis adenylyltransferase